MCWDLSSKEFKNGVRMESDSYDSSDISMDSDTEPA